MIDKRRNGLHHVSVDELGCRLARKEDLPAILKLYQDLFPNEGVLPLERALPIWEEIVKNDDMACFLAFRGGEAAAVCSLAVIRNLTRGGRPYAVIENVVTAAAYRRRGLGRLVVEAAVDHAKRRGCYKVMLMSSAERREAHRFYEAIGFNGSSKRAYELRFQ